MIPNADRFKRAIKAFVSELFPTLDYMGYYEYIVVGKNLITQTLDLQAATNIGLPSPIVKVPMRTGGTWYSIDDGTSVLVGFENHDPTKPFVAFLDRYAGDGFVPAHTGLAGATILDVPPFGAAIARVGDAAGPFLITTGSTKVKSR